MSTSDWEAVKGLLAEALSRPSVDRTRFLREACGNDAKLLENLLGLLEHHGRTGSFLEPPEQSAPPLELHGALLGERYRLGRPCGLGGFGTVYEAEDLLARRRVAVKVLREPAGTGRNAMRREVATLRWLRLPGIVQILDDGVSDGRAFVVMEYVEGTPFPGDTSADWAAIRETSIALIETLARIHWAGVIHCDLKPNNVLVRSDGVPVVLDLGISAGPAVGIASLTELAGTPRYAAPERFSGGAPDPRWDLYSVGVMLQEALAESASAGRTSASLARKGLPADIANLIGRMTAEDPVNRPASAAEVLDSLRGSSDEPEMAWLASSPAVEALVAAGCTARSLDLCGPPGSGFVRCLRAAADRLRRLGREVLLVQPDTRPLASLVAAVGEPATEALGDATRAIAARLRVRLASGAILAVADVSAIDPLSATVIADSRAAGTVLRGLPQPDGSAMELRPATETELRTLFAGPDRALHLREDAARELLRRTGGWPDAVARETAAWVRTGLARREGSNLVVTRAALEQLRLGLWSGAPQPVIATGRDDKGAVLACVDIMREHSTPALVGDALGLAPWVVEAYLLDLVLDGSIAPRPAGGYEPRASSGQSGMLSRETLRRGHSLVADRLPRRSVDRLQHLLSAWRLDDVVAETPGVAEDLMLSGRVWAAESLLLEGLRALHASDDTRQDEVFLPMLLRCALAEGTSTSVDLVLYYCARSRTTSRVLVQVEAIGRAAQLVLQGDGARALALLESSAPFGDIALERARHSVRTIAASEVSVHEHNRVVTEAAAWADAQSDLTLRALAPEWRGWLCYSEGRYVESARLHEQAAALTRETHKRIAALVSAAWSSLEACELDRCRVFVADAKALAADCRHAHLEARAEVILRAVAYRAGEPGEPDTELAEALEMLGMPRVHAVALLTEAAAAWRLDRTARARVMAARSADRFRQAGEAGGAALAAALALACGASEDAFALEAAATERLMPGIALQVLGLLALAGCSLSAAGLQRAKECFSDTSIHPTVRREVASPAEANSWIERSTMHA